MAWLKHQGADTVADLNQLPPGTYSCKDLADDLGLPMLKAQRLLSALEGTQAYRRVRIDYLSALEGTKSSAIHHDVCAALSTTGAQQLHSPPPQSQSQPAAPVRPPLTAQYSERPV